VPIHFNDESPTAKNSNLRREGKYYNDPVESEREGEKILNLESFSDAFGPSNGFMP
jgi:hypothetical protein